MHGGYICGRLDAMCMGADSLFDTHENEEMRTSQALCLIYIYILYVYIISWICKLAITVHLNYSHNVRRASWSRQFNVYVLNIDLFVYIFVLFVAQNLGDSGADRCCRGLAQRLSCMILCVERVCMILVCLSVLFISVGQELIELMLFVVLVPDFK